MSDWKIIDPYYMQNGLYTITKSLNVPKPYCLFKTQPETLYGCFKTAKEAIKRYEEIK
jgi:hypothetical protein